MAQRVEIKTITVPAGTLIASPLTVDLAFRQGHVEQVEIRIPPGPSGLVGVALAHSDTVVIPHDESEWLVTDNEPVRWPFDGFPTSPAWSVRAYNLDQYDHSFQIRMLFAELGSDPAPDVEPLDIQQPLMPQVVTE